RVRVELDTYEDAGAQARGRRAVALGSGTTDQDSRRRPLLVPFDGFRDEFAVAVALGDVGHHDRRQPALHLQRLAAAGDRALVLQILDKQLQLGLRLALDAESPGDVALGHPRWRFLAVWRRRPANEGDKLIARRHGRVARRGAPGRE